ncbi:MAG TPA: hypothetical protein VM052_06495 [Candidatus Limnocylindrales bacterium]|nr:hypothetical protein [Candidatus Limnocylindrales bacterium]
MREQPATELTIATRILARAGALAADDRITLRLKDVVYIGGRDAALATITPYDIAVLLLSDGSTLHGLPTHDAPAYLEAHRSAPGAGSVARVGAGQYISAPSLRACVITALRRAHGEEATSDEITIERAWTELVSQARITGALIGAFATDQETP